MWRLLALVTIGGCWGSAPAPKQTLSNEVPVRVGRMAMFELGRDSFGPITPQTLATEDALRRALGPSVRVETVERRGPELHAYLGTELLFYVIPNDNESLFNIHAVSPKVSIVEHRDWVIGAPFQGADTLTRCECWGEHPMCYEQGNHVALGFVVACENLTTPEQRRALQGVPIQRAVWSPQPFGVPEEEPPPSPSSVTSPPPPSLKQIFRGDP